MQVTVENVFVRESDLGKDLYELAQEKGPDSSTIFLSRDVMDALERKGYAKEVDNGTFVYTKSSTPKCTIRVRPTELFGPWDGILFSVKVSFSAKTCRGHSWNLVFVQLER